MAEESLEYEYRDAEYEFGPTPQPDEQSAADGAEMASRFFRELKIARAMSAR